MLYYIVESSHWPMELEFKSKLKLEEGQCFRITDHDGLRQYPTRFKVLKVSDTPTYTGTLVEVFKVDTEVEKF